MLGSLRVGRSCAWVASDWTWLCWGRFKLDLIVLGSLRIGLMFGSLQVGLGCVGVASNWTELCLGRFKLDLFVLGSLRIGLDCAWVTSNWT